MKKSKQFYILTIAIAAMVLINAGLFLWSQYVKTSALEQANRQTATQLNLISYDMVQSASKTNGRLTEKYIDIISSSGFNRLNLYNHITGIRNKDCVLKLSCDKTVINGTTAITEMGFFVDTLMPEDSSGYIYSDSGGYHIYWEIKNDEWVVSDVKPIFQC